MIIFTTILVVWTVFVLTVFGVFTLRAKQIKRQGSFATKEVKLMADTIANITWPLMYLWPINLTLWLCSLVW